tara:strand:+ start:298 stop:711 length:414 start_codon:yes stop_codon:yes gene_type:complete
MNAIQSQLGLEFKPETQCCNKCGVIKPIEEFGWNSYGSQRFRRKICKQCHKHSYQTKKVAIKKQSGYHKPPVGTPCEVCGVPMTHGTEMTGMCFDHDTVTQEFRGWICKKHNTMLGFLGDNIEGIELLLKYLKKQES